MQLNIIDFFWMFVFGGGMYVLYKVSCFLIMGSFPGRRNKKFQIEDDDDDVDEEDDEYYLVDEKN